MMRASLAKGLSVALSVLLGLAILATVGAIIYIVNDPNAGEKFTEFYLLGPGGKAENYSEEITLGQSAPVLVGIINREKKPATYSFDVLVDNTTTYSKGDISLQNDGKWEGEAPVKPPATGENRKVEFYLYKDSAATPYLKLHLFVNVKQGL
jgi:uncharacterized membrane protein